MLLQMAYYLFPLLYTTMIFLNLKFFYASPNIQQITAIKICISERDSTNWFVTENGNVFCQVDQPYAKFQKYISAMTVCIKNVNVFAHFSKIASQVATCT
ncbi:Large structural protein [Trichinella spiralis]|uniref:Large structural protein n=1 Tax=Trichinella spiralis TaxID=6334 RepID=A0ABR3KG05_TRISP